MEYRKKTKQNKCVNIPKSFINIIDNNIKIAPTYFKNDCIFEISKNTLKNNKNIKIEHDCKIIKQKNKYWLTIPISVNIKEKPEIINYCGIDPGIRTFLTTFGNNGSSEYTYNKRKIHPKMIYNNYILLIKMLTSL